MYTPKRDNPHDGDPIERPPGLGMYQIMSEGCALCGGLTET